MKWTDTKPTKPDEFYWFRYDADHKPEPVLVHRFKGHLYARIGYSQTVDDRSGQWSDRPIPEPEEK